LTSLAIRRRENDSSASAALQLLPRIRPATRFNLRGLTRKVRASACASLSATRRFAFGLLISGPLHLLVRRVAVKRTGRRELAELVTDHVLGDQHRDELLAVVDAEREADELRQDGRPPRPCPDHLVAARLARLLGLLQQIAVDERSLPYG